MASVETAVAERMGYLQRYKVNTDFISIIIKKHSFNSHSIKKIQCNFILSIFIFKLNIYESADIFIYQ